MGFPDWEAYAEALAAQREAVAGHFRALIAAPDDEADTADEGLWSDGLDEPMLAEMGYRDPASSLAALTDLRENGRVLTLQAEGRERLDQFMPLLLRACAEVDDPDLSLERVLPLVLAVVRRSAYLVLLVENPPALAELALLFGVSPWIAEQMTRNPVLLDELLDRASLYTAPDRAMLAEELARQVARLPLHDREAQMDALRYFKASHVLRVAASELTGRLPVMQVSDKLTFIAEVILEQVLAVAWADLTCKYGAPRRDSAGTGFAIYGYGKLGGIELGYGSDLDLVFISDGEPRGVTDGDRSIDNAVFYNRLGQRIVQIMETRMAMGQLYEVDMRLRPNGESGMLVVSLDGFAGYQRDTAWTWEHQALVRARFVAGDPAVAAGVDAVRSEVLCRPRDEQALATEVVAMREKMRKHLLPPRALDEGEFALKQGRGGIVDIEFMVQYAVLAWSHREPELARWSDNVRILETLGREGFFEQHECDALAEAYLALRSAAHQLSLQQQPGIVRAGAFVDARAAVSAKWQELFAAVEGGEETTETS
jgi:glutamate-ammonia-ligase adenylyltransferase